MAKEPKKKVDELLDSLLEGQKPDEIFGQEGLGELTRSGWSSVRWREK